MIGQQVMRGLALYRLHDATRRQVRRDAEQQMDVIGPNVSLHNLNVVRPADLPNQIPHLRADLTAEHRLAILRGEDEEREAAFFGAAFFVVVADFAMILFF